MYVYDAAQTIGCFAKTKGYFADRQMRGMKRREEKMYDCFTHLKCLDAMLINHFSLLDPAHNSLQGILWVNVFVAPALWHILCLFCVLR